MLGRVLTGRMEGVALSEAGRLEAERLAQTLAARPVAAVMSSPLQRARETAAPLAARLGLLVAIEPGLDEIDFGDWAGQTFDALASRADWEAWNRWRSVAACPGGETMLAAQARAVAAVTRLASAHRGGELVLVSHQDVLKSVLAHFLGVPLDLMSRFALDPAHRSVVTLSDGDMRIDGINLPS